MSHFTSHFKGKRRKVIRNKLLEDNKKKYGRCTCELCKQDMNPMKFTIDHIIPVSLGGTNRYNNLQLAHRYCNLKKGNKI